MLIGGKQMRLVAAVILTVLAGMMPGAVSAQSGVGVNVGSIEVDQDLAPGGSYNLPSIGVINTGHDPGDYAVRITYLPDQEEDRPPEDWFRFSPEVFPLEPGESQAVGIHVNLPITARPGDYFALVEASPVQPDRPGVVIGVAVATKLSFTVRSSNRFVATVFWVYHRINDRSPYSYIAVGLIALTVVGYYGRRRLRIRISFERRD